MVSVARLSGLPEQPKSTQRNIVIRNARSRKFRARQARPTLEQLDDRCLPTTVTLAGGVLSVVGTEAADRITLNFNTPRGARGGVLNVMGVGRYPLHRVAAVHVDGRGGDDMIVINTIGRGFMPIPIVVDGGEGNDVIIGGRARQILRGGTGDDIILSRGGIDQIDPGPGHNWVNGKIVVVPPPTPSPAVSPSAVSPPAPVSPPTSPVPAPAPTPAPTSPSPASSFTTPGLAKPDLTAWSQKIVSLTNQQRRDHGLSDLAVDSKLTQAAQIQVDQMVQFDRMQHVLPGAKYPDLASRAQAVDYKFAWFGENIAYNYPDPEGVMQGWMLSEGHRANILNSNYTEIGVAIGFGPHGRPYYAQVFGSPA